MSRSGNKSLRLTGTDGDFAARHAHSIIDIEPASILIVAVNGEKFAETICELYPAADVQIRMLSPAERPQLPVSKQDLVLCFDWISTFPREHRKSAWQWLDEQAKSDFLCCEPLGTDLQTMIARSLLDFMKEREQQLDPVLECASTLGMPTPEEALNWTDGREGVDIFFAGNVNYFRTVSESSIAAADKNKLFGLLIKKAGLDNPAGGATDLEPETVPMRRHRRLYLHRTKG